MSVWEERHSQSTIQQDVAVKWQFNLGEETFIKVLESLFIGAAAWDQFGFDSGSITHKNTKSLQFRSLLSLKKKLLQVKKTTTKEQKTPHKTWAEQTIKTIRYPFWPRNMAKFPWRSWRMRFGGTSGQPGSRWEMDWWVARNVCKCLCACHLETLF